MEKSWPGRGCRGADGTARFHQMVASCLGEDAEPDPARVVVVIETDRGPWVKTLAAAGYRVYPANPKQFAWSGGT